MALVDDLLKQQEQMASERSTFESQWQEVAELVLPDHATFTTRDRSQGQKNSQKQFDSTAQIESARHASAIASLATPDGSKWHGLQSTDPRLNKRDDVRRYYDELTEILFTERSAQTADFAAQSWDVYRAGGVFGNGVLYGADQIGGGVRYRSLPFTEVYISVDSWGRVNRLHRKFKLTAMAAVEEFRDAGDTLPASIRNAASDQPLRKFEFLQCIYPNADQKPGYLDARGMPFHSCEIALEDKVELRRKGFNSWPTPVYRYDTAPGEWYGRGWAMQVLAEIKLLNRARRSQIRQTEKAVDPPLGLHEDGLLGYGSDGKGQTPSLNPGSLNYGAVNSDGRMLVQAIMSGADLAHGKDEINESRTIIKDAALTTLFQILVSDQHDMTATEWLGRMQEKAQLVAPMVGRALSTYLGQVVERDIDILGRQGKLPEMPRVLKLAMGEYRVEFLSPLARLMRLEDVTAAQRWVASLTPYAETHPEVFDRVDFDKFAKITGERTGVPADMIRDDDEVAALQKARGKQQQTASLVGAAPQIAGAIKDVAQAQSYSRSAA